MLFSVFSRVAQTRQRSINTVKNNYMAFEGVYFRRSRISSVGSPTGQHSTVILVYYIYIYVACVNRCATHSLTQ